MTLIVFGCVAPVLVALIVSIRMHAIGPRVPVSERADDGETLATVRPISGRWSGLTDEIAQRGSRPRPRAEDPSQRRRHLAAVLPADSRH